MNLAKTAIMLDVVLQRALTVEAVLDRIQQKMETLQMSTKSVAELLTAMDAATTAVANRIQGYLDTITGGVATAAELAAAKAGIESEIATLTAMGSGSDPNNP